MSEVLPTLWLSGCEDAYTKGFLQRARITHILNCAEELSSHPSKYHFVPESIHHIPLEDDETPEAAKQIQDAVAVLERWQSQGFTVVVHCRAGISRSATVVLAWLIQHRGMSLEDAWKKVVAARNFIRPNDYFMGLLRGYSAAASTSPSFSSSQGCL